MSTTEKAPFTPGPQDSRNTTPKHKHGADQNQAPALFQGIILASIPREKSFDLRLSWEEFDGYPYLSLRIWKNLGNGQAIPSQKGVSIRLRELAALMAGLELAADEVQERMDREANHDGF